MGHAAIKAIKDGMEIGGRKVLVCNCEGTMPLDGKALGRACGAKAAPQIHGHLCRSELELFKAAAGSNAPLLIGCTQEQPLFAELLAEREGPPPAAFVNLRERAGWSAEAEAAMPKIAALLAEAALAIPATPSVTLRSEGVCLVYGQDETAIEAARQLAPRLDVTLLLLRRGDIYPPRATEFPVYCGTIVAARGHLGAFEITVDDYAAAVASSRGALTFEAPQNGVASRCDLILDLSGRPAIFTSRQRDGYFRPDPGNPGALQRALFDLVELVGEFEKPRYVDFTAALCAHSRSRKTGCTRCLDVCPESAIRPDGDVVAIDPYVCDGCGACHSVCPTGAAAYALPPVTALAARLRTLLRTYHEAGGALPALLVHDPRRGEEVIWAMARLGRGLPARVLPFAVNEATQIGLDFLLLAFAYGAAQVVILAPPNRRDELAPLASQIGLAETVLQGLGFGGGRLHVLAEADPDAVEQALYQLPSVTPIAPGGFLAMGDKRALLHLALERLHEVAPAPQEILPLPAGAPFGAVEIRSEGCTLCLACVGACPTGALQDNPETPQLRFQESACVQCGLCKATCPEKVVSLVPRLNFTAARAGAVLLKEEPPFNCVRCGKPFGTKSSIDRILAQLAHKHSMFQDEQRVRLIQMCDECRVIAQIEDGAHPMAGPPRPKPRTTEDYLRERGDKDETEI
jgi:ferredoxin